MNLTVTFAYVADFGFDPQLQSKDQRLAEETLATVIPAINEANLICKDLHQPLRFEIQGEC